MGTEAGLTRSGSGSDHQRDEGRDQHGAWAGVGIVSSELIPWALLASAERTGAVAVFHPLADKEATFSSHDPIASLASSQRLGQVFNGGRGHLVNRVSSCQYRARKSSERYSASSR